MINYKSYSRMRDIAVKRVKRLEEKGFSVGIDFPTVKQVRAMSEMEQSRRFSALSGFLETGLSLSRQKKTVEVFDKKADERRRKERAKRRLKKTESMDKNVPRYKRYLKAIETLGVELKPSQLPGFFNYMDYRLAQGTSAYKYAFSTFVDEYKELLIQGYKPDQIIDDYQQFVADQMKAKKRAKKMSGWSARTVKKSWTQFVHNEG